MEEKDVIIVGGGPAGLAAAVKLFNNGITDILIIERENELSGILRQCIHDGFGLTRFNEALSGPEYAERFVNEVNRLSIPYITNAAVTEISNDKEVTVISREGVKEYKAKAVILTMGCRERSRGALGIPGERPCGVFTAGVAQSYINIYNTMIGKEVIILGSGDIGMIMARRLALEGAHVQAVFEIMPYPSGLPRNIEQCLNDYGIPLYLSHTVTEIHGNARLKGVTVSRVDESLKPIVGTEKTYSCDTLILSVGLIPENELSLKAGVTLDPKTKGAVVDENFQTNIKGIFAAGNVLHVHDLVDYVSLEAERLADSAARYVNDIDLTECGISVTTDSNIGYTVPQRISGTKELDISLRVKKQFKNCKLVIKQDGNVICSKPMKKAIPAEMIRIPVKPGQLISKSSLEVSVEC